MKDRIVRVADNHYEIVRRCIGDDSKASGLRLETDVPIGGKFKTYSEAQTALNRMTTPPTEMALDYV